MNHHVRVSLQPMSEPVTGTAVSTFAERLLEIANDAQRLRSHALANSNGSVMLRAMAAEQAALTSLMTHLAVDEAAVIDALAGARLPTPPALAPLKTDASRRDVPLPTMVAEALAEHLSTSPITGSDLVFRSRADTPIYPGTFRDSVGKRMLREAGLSATMRFHDLRHFTVSALIQGGQSIKTVQAVLGHSSATKTLDIYGHLWSDAKDNARAAMTARSSRPDGSQFRPDAHCEQRHTGPRAVSGHSGCG